MARIQAEGAAVKARIRAIGAVMDDAAMYPDNDVVQWLAHRYLKHG